GTMNYSRSLDLQTESGKHYDGQNIAESVADVFFSQQENISLLTGFVPDSYLSNASKKKQSSIDLINNRFSFSENYSMTSGDPWRWDYNQSLNLDSNGISKVT